MNTIDFLREVESTFGENAGQEVILNMPDKSVKCKFLWFYNDNIIDIATPTGMIAVNKKNWDAISLPEISL